MRRKSILFLLIVAGICNALIAQNLVTKYEYYDYYQSQLKEKYTMLVDGTKHGKSYHYREEGPLWMVQDWNHGDLTTKTTYYLDGKTIKTHTTYIYDSIYYNGGSYDDMLLSNYVEYNINGGIISYYSIKHTPGKLFPFGDGDKLIEYIITSAYDGDWKYTLSSDGNTADIKNIKTGAHFTYNYKKQELKINNLETIFFEKSTKYPYPDEDLVKQKIKNNIVTYEVLKDDEFFHDNGYVYQLPKGLTGQYTIKNIPLSNKEFHSYFFYTSIFNLGCFWPTDPMATKNKVSEYGREEPRQEGLRIPLSDEVLKQDKVVGIQLRDNTSTDINNTKYNRLLKLISGNYQNGVFEYARSKNENEEKLQITTHNSEIVKYKEYKNDYDKLLEWNLEATKFNTSYDENNKCITLDVLEGTLTENKWKKVKYDSRRIVYVDNTSYDVANKDTLTKEKVRRRYGDIEAVYEDKTKVGKFETKIIKVEKDKKSYLERDSCCDQIEYKLIEGEITYNYYDYDLNYKSGEIIISKKVLKKVIDTGKFENDSLIEGKRVIIDKNGEETTYEGKFHNGKFIQGKVKSNGVSMVGSFENDVFVNGTKTLTFNNGTTYILKGNFTENGDLKNGQIDCSGNLSFYIQKPFEFKKMTCTLPSCEVYIEKKNGDVFEGIIPKDILRKFLWRYITTQENPNTTVKGKYTKSDGNILEGTFRNIDILNKDLNVRMLLSGTANFATNFGHYIGGYANGKAIGAGKMIVNELGEFIGYFENDKLSKDSICIVNLKFPNGDTFKGYMLGGKISGYGELRFANGDYYIGEFVEGKFSGTGNVRYTHKKGVYEGNVNNFVCQYDTPQDKKALKKVKSPKVPKIQIPSKVGKMSVTTPE